MSSTRNLLGQTATYGLSSIVGRLLNYLLVPIYTRVFATQEYGVVNELYAYAPFLMILFTYGMETAFFRFVSTNNYSTKVYSTASVSLLTSSALFVLLIGIWAQPIAGWLRYNSHPEYIIWFAFIFGLDTLSAIPFAKLRQENKAMRFAMVKMAGILLNIILNLYFLLLCPYLQKQDPSSVFLLGYSAQTGVGYVFIANLIASAATLLLLSKELFAMRFHFDQKLWKQMIIYALPLLVAGFAGMVNETIDRILLKFLLPFSNEQNLSQIGIYGACYKLSILMTLAIQAFRMAAEPFYFSHAGKDHAQKVYASVMTHFVIVCLIIFLGVMMYIDVIRYFIGESYWQGLAIVPILLLANMFLGIYYNLSVWYKISGKTMYGAYLALGGAAITLFLNFLWIPSFGYMGSAWATFACYLLMATGCYLIGQKFYPVSYQLRKIVTYILFAVALYLASEHIVNKVFMDTLSLKLSANTLLLFSFITVVFMRERPDKKLVS